MVIIIKYKISIPPKKRKDYLKLKQIENHFKSQFYKKLF